MEGGALVLTLVTTAVCSVRPSSREDSGTGGGEVVVGGEDSGPGDGGAISVSGGTFRLGRLGGVGGGSSEIAFPTRFLGYTRKASVARIPTARTAVAMSSVRHPREEVWSSRNATSSSS
jgi:hypothetical protein